MIGHAAPTAAFGKMRLRKRSGLGCSSFGLRDGAENAYIRMHDTMRRNIGYLVQSGGIKGSSIYQVEGELNGETNSRLESLSF